MRARRLKHSPGDRVIKDKTYLVTQKGEKLFINDEHNNRMHITSNNKFWELLDVTKEEYDRLPRRYRGCVKYIPLPRSTPSLKSEGAAKWLEAREIIEVEKHKLECQRAAAMSQLLEPADKECRKMLREGIERISTNQQQENNMKIEKVILVDGKRADEISFDRYLELIRFEQAKLESLDSLPVSKAVANRKRVINSNIKNLTILMDRYANEEG